MNKFCPVTINKYEVPAEEGVFSFSVNDVMTLITNDLDAEVNEVIHLESSITIGDGFSVKAFGDLVEDVSKNVKDVPETAVVICDVRTPNIIEMGIESLPLSDFEESLDFHMSSINFEFVGNVIGCYENASTYLYMNEGGKVLHEIIENEMKGEE